MSSYPVTVIPSNVAWGPNFLTSDYRTLCVREFTIGSLERIVEKYGRSIVGSDLDRLTRETEAILNKYGLTALGAHLAPPESVGAVEGGER